MLKINILRSEGPDSFWQSYELPFQVDQQNTILTALLHIRQELDPTLSFRYGCRFHRCGMCAVQIDGKPRLACREYLQQDQRIAPLPGLPVLKDLVIDRRVLWPAYRQLQLYIPSYIPEELPQLKVSQLYYQLARCSECLACLSTCPRFLEKEPGFWGPWLFTKLALLHTDPRDKQDRFLQAKNLGLSRCGDCLKCSCITGLPVRQALKMFLDKG